MGTQFYKHPKYGTTYGEVMLTPTGRLAWPALIKPREAPPAKEGEVQSAPRYEVTIILPKDDKTVQAWIKAMEKMTAEMLVVFNQGRKGKISIDSVLKDGEDFDAEKYPYYQNCYLLIARNAKLTPEQLVDGQKNQLAADQFVGGMFVRGTVTPIITGWGLSYKLEALQRVKDDGVRFAGSNRAGAMLDMIPTVEDSESVEETAEPTETETPEQPAKTGKKKALDLL